MHINQLSFSAGEISSNLYGRRDLAKYNTGAKILENIIVHPQGGISNRPGTKLINEYSAAVAAGRPRIIPFEFSSDQSYLLFFGINLLMIYKNDALIHQINQPFSTTHLADVDYVQSADIMFFAHPAYPPYRLSRYSDTNWQMEEIPFDEVAWADRKPGDDGISLTSDSISGTATLTASSSFFTPQMVGMALRLGYEDVEDPNDIKWGWVTIDSVAGITEATVSIEENLGYDLMFNGDFDTGLEGWEDYSSSPGTLTYDGTNDAAVLSGAYGSMLQQIDYFNAKVKYTLYIDCELTSQGNARIIAKTTREDEGYLKKIEVGLTQAREVLEMEFYSPGESANLFINIDTRDTILGSVEFKVYNISLVRSDMATSQWRYAAWGSVEGINLGYPARVTFYEQRLCYASSPMFPQTIWMSKTGSFLDFGFSSPIQDDDSISYTIASRKIDAIQWMIPMSELIIGTYNAIWMVSGGGDNPITPTTILAKIQTTDGCAAIRPITTGNTIIYLQRGGKIIRDLSYSFEQDSYQGADLTILAQHLFDFDTVATWDYAGLKDRIVYCIDTWGRLLTLAHMPEHEVMAWSRNFTNVRFLAGAGYVGDRYRDVCTLSNQDGDSIYFLVNRFIYNQSTSLWNWRYCLEKQAERIATTADTVNYEYSEITRHHELAEPYSYYLMDAIVEYYDGGNTSDTVTGLDHLVNQEVSILADGELLPNQTLVGNSVNIGKQAERIIVGLSYESRVETLDYNLDQAQHKKKAVNSVRILFKKTRGEIEVAMTGLDFYDKFVPMRMRDYYDDYITDWSTWFYADNPMLLRSGYYQVLIESRWQESVCIHVRMTQPLPFTILSINPEVAISEG